MERMWWIACIVVSLAGCSGPGGSSPDKWDLVEDENNDDGETNNNTTTDDDDDDVIVIVSNNHNNSTNNTIVTNTTSCLTSAPVTHRPDRSECDDVRGPGVDVDPDHPAVDCLSDTDCTDGRNGRCIGNGHDGYYCSYDRCLTDSECGTDSVCECEGGWRGDHNVCLQGNCATDADCGPGGYCSPSQGDCGAYSGTVGYFCHTCEDECVNDSDCGNGDPWGSYCAYDPGVGHWRCSSSQCAG